MSNTTGKANNQAVSHVLIHKLPKLGVRPVARKVDIPETMRDMSPDRIRANNIGLYFLAII